VVLLILSAVVALIALAVANVISLPIALIGVVVVIMFAAWRLDRARSAGAPPPYKDANRPDFYGHASTWQVPTPYIDHPTGAGEPPGVDRGDEPAPRR
jgi:hypothetical protein